MKTMEVRNRVSNDGEFHVHEPFTVIVVLQGTCDMLFHKWSCEDVAAKAAAAKGSKAKKEDNVESYVYRDDKGQICIPGRYLYRSIVEAARNHQDPRSPRKAAKDLTQASIRVGPTLAPMLVIRDEKYVPCKDWDYLDQQRVVIQRNAVTRQRPAFRKDWRAEFQLTSLQAEYLTETFLRRLVQDSGRFVGLGDFRPTYGLFDIVSWEQMKTS